MRRLILCVGLLLAMADRVQAQVVPCTGPVGTPPTWTCQVGTGRTAQWDYAGMVAGDVIKFLVNNAQVGADIPAINGTMSVVFGAALAAGTYTVVVQAVRGSLVTPSGLIGLILTPLPVAPGAPTNLRIVELRFYDEEGFEVWNRVLFLPERPS